MSSRRFQSRLGNCTVDIYHFSIIKSTVTTSRHGYIHKLGIVEKVPHTKQPINSCDCHYLPLSWRGNPELKRESKLEEDEVQVDEREGEDKGKDNEEVKRKV